MKQTTIYTIVLFLLGTFYTKAQTGCMPEISAGNKIHSIAHNYYQDFDMDETGKLAKMKLAKREKAVAEFNGDILSGKVKPKSWPMYTEVSNIYDENEMRAIEMSYLKNNQTVSNFYVCENDTMYITRMDGRMFIRNANEDTIGVSVYGIAKMPLDLKVGDALPTYTDFTWMFPIGYEAKGAIKVFAGYDYHSGTDYGTFTDSRTGKQMRGYYNYVSRTKKYMDKEVPGYMTMKTKNVTIYNAYSAVTREEEVEVDGKKYTALVIESENWSKLETDFQFYSHYQEANERFEKGKSFLEKMYAKKFEKFGMINEFGYTPSYITQYFVPEIGIVKTINYDTFGRIMSIIDVEGIVEQ